LKIRKSGEMRKINPDLPSRKEKKSGMILLIEINIVNTLMVILLDFVAAFISSFICLNAKSRAKYHAGEKVGISLSCFISSHH